MISFFSSSGLNVILNILLQRKTAIDVDDKPDDDENAGASAASAESAHDSESPHLRLEPPHLGLGTWRLGENAPSRMPDFGLNNNK